MRFWIGVLSAAGAAGIVGFAAGVIATEDKFRKEYQESAESFRRAMELARETREDPEAPLPDNTSVYDKESKEWDKLVPETSTVEKDAGEPFQPETHNPYHAATNAVDTPVETFVSGGVNDYGISYIEEEEYQDDDDRPKFQVTFVMSDGHTPQFFMDGVEIRDWDTRLGDSILVDFYKRVPPGIPQVLYVRNHNTDEDYEVIREEP